MRFNLYGVRIERQTQMLDKMLRENFPLHIGISSDMRIVIAHRAIDSSEQCDLGDICARAAQAMHHVGEFLAQRGG